MRNVVDPNQGFVSHKEGEGFFVGDKPLEEAAFNNRYVDLFGELSEAPGLAALTYEEYRDTGFFMKFMRHTQPDKVVMTYQMPHGWAGTDVYPHMHCIPMAAEPGTASFAYAYAWAAIDDEIPSGLSWVSGSINVGFSAADQYKHKMVSFAMITPPTGANHTKTSTMLFFSMEFADGTYSGSKDHGTATANIGILYFDAHVQLRSAGSVGEYWY